MSSRAGKDRVLFLADCGPAVGGGHVMRSLSLARALAGRGVACAFLAPPAVERVLDAFPDGRIERLPAPEGPLQGLLEACAGAADAWGAGVIVLDHYGLAAGQEAGLRGGGRRLVVVDDLADRPHDCELLIDATLGRAPEAYAGLIPAGARALTGPAYALLRPEYAAARQTTLAGRRPLEPPRRLLVSLGLMDFRGITGRVLHLVQPLAEPLRIDVAVGSTGEGLPWLRRAASQDDRIALHVDTPDMAALIAAADIGIGAGGSSTWERAALGLPSLSLILADNQRDLAVELDRRGAVLAVETRGPDFPQALAAGFRRLMEDGELRARLSAASAALCDGSGALRAADAVLGLAVHGEA